MVRASRSLLSAVTRLLIMADMIDVHLLMKKLRRVEDDLEFLKSVSSQALDLNRILGIWMVDQNPLEDEKH